MRNTTYVDRELRFINTCAKEWKIHIDWIEYKSGEKPRDRLQLFSEFEAGTLLNQIAQYLKRPLYGYKYEQS